MIHNGRNGIHSGLSDHDRIGWLNGWMESARRAKRDVHCHTIPTPSVLTRINYGKVISDCVPGYGIGRTPFLRDCLHRMHYGRANRAPAWPG